MEQIIAIVTNCSVSCCDLENLTNWLNANKISWNVSKTEQILFKPKMKKLSVDHKLKIKWHKCRLYPTKSVKYNGIKIGEKLTWIDHINNTATAIKFNAMIFKAMLNKVKEFVNTNSLCYHWLSLKLFNYNVRSKQKFHESVNYTAKRALCIMSFECRNAHSNRILFLW